MRFHHGTLLSVDVEPLADFLDQDAALGATLLYVGDAGDFDEGATIRVDTEETDYVIVEVDYEAETLLITPGLTAAAEAGDQVKVMDPRTGLISTVMTAQVATGDIGDAVTATVAFHLAKDLPEGIREGVGEPVRMVRDGTEWLVIDVTGVSAVAPSPKGYISFSAWGVGSTELSPPWTVAESGCVITRITYGGSGADVEIHVNDDLVHTVAATDSDEVSIPLPAGSMVRVKGASTTAVIQLKIGG